RRHPGDEVEVSALGGERRIHAWQHTAANPYAGLKAPHSAAWSAVRRLVTPASHSWRKRRLDAERCQKPVSDTGFRTVTPAPQSWRKRRLDAERCQKPVSD